MRYPHESKGNTYDRNRLIFSHKVQERILCEAYGSGDLAMDQNVLFGEDRLDFFNSC